MTVISFNSTLKRCQNGEPPTPVPKRGTPATWNVEMFFYIHSSLEYFGEHKSMSFSFLMKNLPINLF